MVVIDVVTDRQSNLHRELMPRLEAAEDALGGNGGHYAAAYHPIQRNGATSLDVWNETLAIGGPLPTVPRWLRG